MHVFEQAAVHEPPADQMSCLQGMTEAVVQMGAGNASAVDQAVLQKCKEMNAIAVVVQGVSAFIVANRNLGWAQRSRPAFPFV